MRSGRNSDTNILLMCQSKCLAYLTALSISSSLCFRVVAQKFQEFAQKKKLKHAGDPDVMILFKETRIDLFLFMFAGVYQRSSSPYKESATVSERASWSEFP